MVITMQQIIQRYLTKFDEAHKLLADLIVTEDSPRIVWDRIYTLLEDAYLEGFASVGEMLQDFALMGISDRRISDLIGEVVDGETTESRVYKYSNAKDWNSLDTVLETEYHRMYVSGQQDKAYQVQGTVMKRWITVGDYKVRDNHRFLEGVELPIDGVFVTLDGDMAEAPSMFSKGENNVNCRCILGYTVQ